MEENMMKNLLANFSFLPKNGTSSLIPPYVTGYCFKDDCIRLFCSLLNYCCIEL